MVDDGGTDELAGFGFDLPEDDWMRQLRSDLCQGLPERIGRYRVLRATDGGGQAVVLLAHDEEGGRSVALKRHRAGRLATETERARFRREIEVTANLSHPGIVRVLGIESIDDEPLICLEWIDGVRVDEWAAAHRDDADYPCRILEVFGEICDAVAHAHDHGVLHRDIKPSNVLVDQSGHAKVLDFGVAGLLADSNLPLTRTHEFVGTPVYAAPERLAGTAAAPDTRSDVYSLAVLLYQMLTGSLPWRMDGRLVEAIRRIRTQDPDPAVRHDRRVAPELDAILRMALARSPDDRYQSVHALAEDLRRYREGAAIVAVVAGPWHRALSFVRRRRVAIAAVAVAVATVLWLAWLLGERSRELEARRRAAKERRDASSTTSGEPSPGLERFDLLTTLSAVRRAIEVSSELQQRPATAEHAPAMRGWLSELARPLVEEGAELDRALAELAVRSPDWTEDRARELARREQSLRRLAGEHAERLAEAGPFGRGLSRAWPVFQRLREERAGLARDLAVALAGEEDRYVHEVLVELVAEIETLRSFSIPVIEARLAWAEEVRSRTVDRHANAWREAAEAIRVHPRYGGLALAPQVGLVPLGESPQSGLWEFAHVRSAATEELPAVDASGVAPVTEDSGIVFVLIPPGRGPREEPVAPFFLAKQELTRAQFDRLSPVPCPGAQTGADDPRQVTDRTLPVEGVPQELAQRLLRAYGLKLPDEAVASGGVRAARSIIP